MPSSRTGHYVRIWRDVDSPKSRLDGMPAFIEVGGRRISRTISRGMAAYYGNWSTVSRELDLRRARRFARMYARAGFPSQVVFEGHGVNEVVLELKAHRKRGRR